MEKPTQKSPRGNHNAPCENPQSQVRLDTQHSSFFNKKICNCRLLEINVFGLLQNGLHPKLVGFFVTLYPRSPDRWTFCLVEHPKLDPSSVGVSSHRTALRINLTNNMPLSQA